MSLEGYSLLAPFPPENSPEWAPDSYAQLGNSDAHLTSANFAFVAVVSRKFYGKRELQQAYFYAKIRPNTRVKAFRQHFSRPNMVVPLFSL